LYLYPLTGSVGETVTDLSQRLLAHHGGLRGLFRLDVAELARVRGLGDGRFARLKAALVLRQRFAACYPHDLSGDVARFLRGQEDKERRQLRRLRGTAHRLGISSAKVSAVSTSSEPSGRDQNARDHEVPPF
jgi:hypothetical protein